MVATVVNITSPLLNVIAAPPFKVTVSPPTVSVRVTLPCGMAPAVETDIEDWRWMYEVNVLGSVRMVQALLPAMLKFGRGHVVNITSVAGHAVYEGGSGYAAAKHAQRALSETLRLELNGKPVRITEIAPGMVKTEEFSLNRLGDADRAEAVYAGVAEPLVAEDIADCVAFAVTRPPHVDVDLLVVRPLAQAASYKVHREHGV